MACCEFRLATQVLGYSSMDFALVAPELSPPPMLPVNTPPAEPNAEWILSWMEVAPPPSASIATESLLRVSILPMSTVTALAPEWPIESEALSIAPETERGEEEMPAEAETLVVGTLLPADTENESSDEKSEEETAPVMVVVSAGAFATAPIANDEAAPSQPRVLDSGRQRLATPPEFKIATPLASDKGEVIWEADLVVAAPPIQLPMEATNESELQLAETTIPAVRSARPNVRSDHEESWQDNGPNEQRPGAEQEVERKTASTPSTRAEAQEKGEPEPPAVKRVPSIEKTDAPVPTAPLPRSPVEVAAGTKIEPEEATARVESIAPAERLRPAQVARLQVDITGPEQAPGADPSMRLVVTQRGENVSVQLRSWDDSVAPLPATDVKPLLDNLAKRGLGPANESAIESAAAIEPPKERPIVLAQVAANQQDARGFNGFDERQQRQQEQHRQQQELFARRQQRPSEEFDLKSVLDEIHKR